MPPKPSVATGPTDSEVRKGTSFSVVLRTKRLGTSTAKARRWPKLYATSDSAYRALDAAVLAAMDAMLCFLLGELRHYCLTPRRPASQRVHVSLDA